MHHARLLALLVVGAAPALCAPAVEIKVRFGGL